MIAVVYGVICTGLLGCAEQMLPTLQSKQPTVFTLLD